MSGEGDGGWLETRTVTSTHLVTATGDAALGTGSHLSTMLASARRRMLIISSRLPPRVKNCTSAAEDHCVLRSMCSGVSHASLPVHAWDRYLVYLSRKQEAGIEGPH